jgi:hypothetical protein
MATFVYFSTRPNTLQSLKLLKIQGNQWSSACQFTDQENAMIILILTLAIFSLFALTVTGSIASTTRRRH